MQKPNTNDPYLEIQESIVSKLGEIISSLMSLIKPFITQAEKGGEINPTVIPIPYEPEQGFYTRKQAAKFMSCSPSTIRNRMKSGKLKYYSWGRRVFFKKEDLIASAIPSTDLS
ncbi:helix-turn-helix domain-containing protein [Pontibacter vulgaris]|uniref:helix-turn-helix domain-containing protein n=1 Tax=Pontibacter vulgaris TaxID=2905679 RepID=UPI001FA6C890|nr:helix-turn-helix domain-containing protein [Pontibacter vulgaris]